jgi:hypothetical protein
MQILKENAMVINISDFNVQMIEENDRKVGLTKEILSDASKELLDDIHTSDYWTLLAQGHCFGYATVKQISDTEAQITHFRVANQEIHRFNLGGKILRELEKYYLSMGYTAILTKLPKIHDFDDTVKFFQERGYLKDTKTSKNENLSVLRNEILGIEIQRIEEKQKKYDLIQEYSNGNISEQYLAEITDSTFWAIMSNKKCYGYSSLKPQGVDSSRINNFVIDTRLLETCVPTELYLAMENDCKRDKRSIILRIPSGIKNFSNPLASFFKRMKFYKYINISSDGKYILLIKSFESKLKRVELTTLPKSTLLNVENCLLLNQGEAEF